jgi:hypothetical protein
LGFLRLTKGGHASIDADGVFAELANERFCRPRLPRSPAHWMRSAKRSSTAPLRSTFTLPSKLLPVQLSPRSRQTSQRALTPRPAKQPPTNARQQHRRQQPPAQHPLPSRPTKHGHRPRNDGVARRADSYSPTSSFMRHRVRRRWREWERIGASGQVLSWIQKAHPTVTKDSKTIQRTTKVLLNHIKGMGR